VLRTLILGVLVGTTLPANDLDVFLSFGLLSPQKNVSNQTVDAFGQTTGQVFQAAENFKMAGLGVSYTLLNLGDFRIRGEAEYGTSVQNPGATLRYLAPGVTDQYVEAEGTLKARSAQVGLTATYVSSGAGEYGVTFEERFDTLDFDITQATVSFPGQETVITGQTLSKTFTDPFLRPALHDLRPVLPPGLRHGSGRQQVPGVLPGAVLPEPRQQSAGGVEAATGDQVVAGNAVLIKRNDGVGYEP